MRKMLTTLAVVLGFLAAGCGSRGPDEEPGHEGDAAETATHGASEIPGTVRIDPEMLRDLRITTTMAESREGSEEVTVLGEVGVNEEAFAEVGSPVEARVMRLLVASGSTVKPGEALVELQSMELGKARAAYLSAKARADLADQTLERKRGLAAERIAPVREVQEAEAEARAAQAELQAARASLQALGIGEPGESGTPGDASRFLLRSPIAGTVVERNATRGQLADPSTSLFHIADLSRLWLTVHAFERDAVRVTPGTSARLTFPALPGREFSGTVTLIGRQVDTGSRTIPIRVEVANERDLLRPGMSATAWLPVGKGSLEIVSVPAACLQRVEEEWVVFLPGEEGLFEIREVGRGRDLGGEVEILTGLQPGETVVVEGAFLLKAEAEKSRGEGAHHDH